MTALFHYKKEFFTIKVSAVYFFVFKQNNNSNESD